MNNLANKLSIIFRSSICLLGVVSVGNFLVAPAHAQQARAIGAATLIRPSGSFLSVSGEILLPSGSYIDGGLTVTPSFGGVAGGNQETITGLTITPGAIRSTTISSPNTIVDALVTSINNSNAASIEDITTLIRAGAGNNGLGALD